MPAGGRAADAPGSYRGAMVLPPGATVDRYEVLSLLASGGMADVYVVRHRTLDIRRALKVLRQSSEPLRQRLIREGRAQAGLQHPNVVQVLDVVDVEGAPGLVLELVDGPALSSLVGSGLPLDLVEHYVGQVCRALSAAHAAGIVHRDLKPGNVLVDPELNARVTDFGLAALLAEEPASKLTRPGAPLGTPSYMAPEQFDGVGKVDPRADVWALGVLTYELLAGATPTEGATVLAGWQRMLEGRWRPIDERVPDLPPRVGRAIRWALAPAPADRCPSAEAFWSALSGQTSPPPAAPRSAAPKPLPAPARETWAGSTPPSIVRTLVGRSSELARATDLLEARGGFVTLLGTGGVGKTRLAAELAARWQGDGRELVWVDLEPARTEEDLVHRVGFAIGDAGDGSVHNVGRALARRPLLLVADNLEQLPREVARVFDEWLRQAPSLRVLGTSRQAVGAAGEQVVEVLPMPAPGDGDPRATDAWRVLVQAAPAGTLDAVGPELAAALLTALDGLPLALELAAARLEVLEPAELAARLSRRFDVLADPDAAGRRHGALRDTIGWSWSLLPEGERRALAALSVFRGPFPLTAAEAVVGPRALDALHGLVRRSLVRRAKGRFSLLGSIRDFAAEHLGGSAAEVRARHARWVADAARAVRGPARCGDLAAVGALEELAPEGWAALDAARGAPELVEPAWRAADALTSLYRIRGPLRGLLALADAALGLSGGPRELELAFLLMRGFALRRTGRQADAERALDRAVEAAGPEPSEGRALALAHLADLYIESNRHAAPLYEQVVAIAEVTGPRHLVRTAAAALATLTSEDRPRSEGWWRRSEAAADPADAVTELVARKQRAWILLEWDELAAARDAYLAVIPLAERLGDRRTLAYAAGQLGLVAEVLGDLPEALARLDTVIAYMDAEGDVAYAAWYRMFRARVLARLDRWDGALRDARTALAGATDDRVRRQVRWVALALELRAGVPPAPTDDGDDPLPAALRELWAASRAGRRAESLATSARARELVGPRGVEQAAFLEHLLAELAPEGWRFAADGTWFERPSGERTDTSRHLANARILAHLVARRLEAPGEVSDVATLAEAGWPGERIVPKAAGNRVRVALSTLRQLGLEPLVERAEGGWRLAPGVPVGR